jgi:hypothetical protein
MTSARELTPIERWEAGTSGPERILQAALRDPALGLKEKARIRLALLRTTLGRLETFNI